MIVIAMGVCGTGKSLIGEMLAQQLACEFIDGDTLHSAANKRKMSRGIPLNDQDRMPWLQAIRQVIEEKQRQGEHAVLTCSSLKRAYRDILRGFDKNDVEFVYLRGTYDLLKERLASREEHFFDPSLLNSQLETLEEPDEREAIAIDISLTPEQIVQHVLQELGVLEIILKEPVSHNG
ncbi:MAG: gluconokinase [Acinetobacter sp.]